MRSRRFVRNCGTSIVALSAIATFNLSAAELADEMDDGGKPAVDQGIDVQQTNAAPVEPLTTSY